MKRVLIIGCAGAGKTTLSRQLQEKLGLPVVHLDQIYWSPGYWEHLRREDFDKMLHIELEKPQWIIEGNFDRTLPLRLTRCDTVIWLDYSRFVCMGRWFKRIVLNWGKVRSDMAPGCLERFEWGFAKTIWNFNRDNRRKYETLLAEQENKKIYRIKSPRQLAGFVDSVQENK